MLDSNEHIDEPLLSDDRPAWVTMEKNGGAGDAELPWDRPSTSAERKTNNEGESGADDLPKIIIFMRLGNLGAAGLLIFGSVRLAFDVFDIYDCTNILQWMISHIFCYICVMTIQYF
jgi:hypothetical protein